jgi:hypothetical protein
MALRRIKKEIDDCVTKFDRDRDAFKVKYQSLKQKLTRHIQDKSNVQHLY